MISETLECKEIPSKESLFLRLSAFNFNSSIFSFYDWKLEWSSQNLKISERKITLTNNIRIFFAFSNETLWYLFIFLSYLWSYRGRGSRIGKLSQGRAFHITFELDLRAPHLPSTGWRRFLLSFEKQLRGIFREILCKAILFQIPQPGSKAKRSNSRVQKACFKIFKNK